MEKLIIVGCGEHYRSNLAPALSVLESNNLVEVVATVDVKDTIDASPFFRRRIFHLSRHPDQLLSALLHDFRKNNPIILLAHSNSWHIADTVDLIQNGYRVLLEKPYAINLTGIATLNSLFANYPNQIAFAEYYLMMKSIPILHAADLLNSGSFIFGSPDYLMSLIEANSVEEFRGILKKIGRPRMVYCDILEGEGLTGTFHHRGYDFFDRRNGGGIIMDLAIHSLAPLIALEDFIGNIPEKEMISARGAYCDIYLNHAKDYHKIPLKFIAESFAEIHFTTNAQVPVTIMLGKYVLPNANQRRLIIIGDEGEALLDMSSCTLIIGLRDQCPIEILRTPKNPESKYAPVLRSLLDIFGGTSPYRFESNKVALRGQELALAIADSLLPYTEESIIYASGATPNQILTSVPK